MSETVSLKLENGIGEIILNRPEAFNAFNLEIVEALAQRLMPLAHNQEIRALVISGAGRAFCAGGDLKWAASFPAGPPAAFHTLAGRFHQSIMEIRRLPLPVIAAVNGVAAGAGFSLALACDFRVMAQSAVLRQAYTSAGLCIDGGGTHSLPRLVGLAKALEIAAFDRPISAEQALAWGLATKVVPDGQALESAWNMARELAGLSLDSFRWAKRLLIDSFQTPLEVQLENERLGLTICAGRPDGREGMKAFTEKRKPKFPAS
ncbi:MAG: enoyl-CoA hydratase-related protein [Thermodesulfobacteriota bacterium]